MDAESGAGLKVRADEITVEWDGHCGVGVRVENTSDHPVKFVEADEEVFDGSSTTEWRLALPHHVPEDGAVRGYDVGPFPTTLEPGAVATHAVVVYCKEDPSYTITVNSINAGSVSFDF
ncbi:hypothetical protein [Agromyces neolithicus]